MEGWGCGGLTKKTFADTCVPQDAQLISNSAFISFLTLVLTRPYKFISIPSQTAAAHQQRRQVTFGKKERAETGEM